MANLLGANIGTNYKGFLNLDSTINTPLDATLRAVTDGMGNVSPLQLSTDQVGLIRTIALSAGATNPRLFNEVYTINNVGAQTGTLTGIFLNATETALNGMGHNLIDLQVGGVSKFKVDRMGLGTFASSVSTSGNINLFQNWAILSATAPGKMVLMDSTAANWSALQLGGTTSSFPSIKRNGAAIDFRLADDSGYCDIRTGQNTTIGLILFDTNGSGRGRGRGLEQITGTSGAGGTRFVSNPDSTLVDASAQLQADSTTKGFLPPRMTTTQKNAIASPAAGLVVFDTTLNKLAVFTTVWEAITSV